MDLLRDLLRMMVADGHLPEVEKRLFATAAAVMAALQAAPAPPQAQQQGPSEGDASAAAANSSRVSPHSR